MHYLMDNSYIFHSYMTYLMEDEEEEGEGERVEEGGGGGEIRRRA